MSHRWEGVGNEMGIVTERCFKHYERACLFRQDAYE